MSKLYHRPRTPPGPPPLPRKSSTTRSSKYDSGKRYIESSKSTRSRSRDYDKYRSYDKFDNDDKYERYDKTGKFDRFASSSDKGKYDKFDKSRYDKYENSSKSKYDKYDKNDKIRYDKYDDKYGKNDKIKFDKFERNSKIKYDKYEKSDTFKYDRFGKSDKIKCKSPSYLSGKDYSPRHSSTLLKGTDKYSRKSSPYAADTYRPKSSTYSSKKFTPDRDSYYSKYPTKSTDKYSSSSKFSPARDKGLTSKKYSSFSDNDKKYSSTYSTSKNDSYSNYRNDDDDSYYTKSGNTYDSYSRKRSIDRKTPLDDRKTFRDRSYSRSPLRKRYNSQKLDDVGGGYERYVIGDSVVYGSPGHYPKNLYSPPHSGRARTPLSPGPVLSSRFTPSPRHYGMKGDSFTDHSFQDFDSHDRYGHESSVRNYSSPPGRGNGFNANRLDYGRGGRTDRHGNFISRIRDSRDTYRFNDRDAYVKFPSSYDTDVTSYKDSSRDRQPRDAYTGRTVAHPKSPQSPQPLLSIPVSLRHVPKESRENIKEILCNETPWDASYKGGRFQRDDRRVGMRNRRPNDLRSWIEFKKTGTQRPSGGLGSNRRSTQTGVRPMTTTGRSRLLVSRRRILDKGKRRNPVMRRGLGTLSRPMQSKLRARARKEETDADKPAGSPHKSSNRTDKGSKERETKTRKECVSSRDRKTESSTKPASKNSGASGGTSRKRLDAKDSTKKSIDSRNGKGKPKTNSVKGHSSSVRKPAKLSSSGEGAKRIIKRARESRPANRLPLKSRPRTKLPLKSSQDRPRTVSKLEKDRRPSVKSKEQRHRSPKQT